MFLNISPLNLLLLTSEKESIWKNKNIVWDPVELSEGLEIKKQDGVQN